MTHKLSQSFIVAYTHFHPAAPEPLSTVVSHNQGSGVPFCRVLGVHTRMASHLHTTSRTPLPSPFGVCFFYMPDKVQTCCMNTRPIKTAAACYRASNFHPTLLAHAVKSVHSGVH